MGYESLLLLGILAVLLLLPHLLIGHLLHRVASPLILWAHLFLVRFRFAWFWTHGGQTLAMRARRLRVVTKTGRAITPTQALLRFLLSWPSLGIFGIGILWALVDRRSSSCTTGLPGRESFFVVARNSTPLEPPDHSHGRQHEQRGRGNCAEKR